MSWPMLGRCTKKRTLPIVLRLCSLLSSLRRCPRRLSLIVQHLKFHLEKRASTDWWVLFNCTCWTLPPDPDWTQRNKPTVRRLTRAFCSFCPSVCLCKWLTEYPANFQLWVWCWLLPSEKILSNLAEWLSQGGRSVTQLIFSLQFDADHFPASVIPPLLTYSAQSLSQNLMLIIF